MPALLLETSEAAAIAKIRNGPKAVTDASVALILPGGAVAKGEGDRADRSSEERANIAGVNLAESEGCVMNRERRDESGRRVGLNQAATLTNSDGIKIKIVFRDVSRDGFRISHAGADLTVGEVVILNSARGEKTTGQLKWATETEAGGVFLDPPEALN